MFYCVSFYKFTPALSFVDLNGVYCVLSTLFVIVILLLLLKLLRLFIDCGTDINLSFDVNYSHIHKLITVLPMLYI